MVQRFARVNLHSQLTVCNFKPFQKKALDYVEHNHVSFTSHLGVVQVGLYLILNIFGKGQL